MKYRKNGYRHESPDQKFCTIAEISFSFKHHEIKWCGKPNSQSRQPTYIPAINPMIIKKKGFEAAPAHYGAKKIQSKSRVV